MGSSARPPTTEPPAGKSTRTAGNYPESSIPTHVGAITPLERYLVFGTIVRMPRNLDPWFPPCHWRLDVST